MTAEADGPNDHHPNDHHPNDPVPDGHVSGGPGGSGGFGGFGGRSGGGDADETPGRWFRPNQTQPEAAHPDPAESGPARPGPPASDPFRTDVLRTGSLPSVSPPPASLFTPRSERRATDDPPGASGSPAPAGYPVTPGTSATFDPLQDPPTPARGFETAAARREPAAPADRWSEPAGRRSETAVGITAPASAVSASSASSSAEETEPDAGTSSVVHESIAELAPDAYDGGDHAAEPGEITERTLAPLLLHSLTDLREIWVPLIEASGARSVAEVGSESGATTSLLVNLLRRGGGGRLVVIDPEPGVAPTSGGGLDVEVIRGYSPEALDGHAPTDAYLIDGDHNYATVSGELAAIGAAVRDFGRAYFPLVILHDVGWPAGRRDQYYSPDRIPEADRQPNSWDVGVEIDKADAIPGRGFRGMGAFSWALTEGGPRNGVRTAVEDFAAAHPDLRFITVAPVFGLGVLLDRRAPWARRVADLLAPWVSNTLLSRMERNRIDLYLRVLALQDDAVAAARGRQREWARLDAERSEFAARDLQRLNRISELEQELAAARRQPRPPWAPATPDEPKLVTAARIARAALRSRLGDDPASRAPGAPGSRPASAAVVRLGSTLSRFVEHRSPGGTNGKPTDGDPDRPTPRS